MILSPFYAAPSQANVSAQADVRYGGTLRIGYPKDPISFNGIVDRASSAAYITQNVFNRMFTFGDDYNLHGDVMAGLPTMSSTAAYPSIFEVKIRPGILYHNGDELTAEDVVFHFETLTWGGQARDDAPSQEIVDRLEMPAYMAQSYFADLKIIEMVDDLTVKFYFDEITNNRWLQEWHGPYNILSKDLMEDFNKNNPAGQTWEDNEYNNMPVGTGPYEVIEYKKDQHIIMERFDNYFNGIPYLDSLQWIVNPDPVSQLLALENGEIDTIHENSNFPQAEIARLNKDPDFSVDGFPYTTSWRVTINHHEDAVATWPWLGDVEVLKAMEYAIDKQTICTQVLFDITNPTSTPLTWIVQPYAGDLNKPEFGYTGPWAIVSRDYNADMARDLLEGAGWTLNDDGVRHQVIGGMDYKIEGGKMPYYAYATDWAEAITEYWGAVGINVEAIPMESTIFFDMEVDEFGLNNKELGGPYSMSLNTMGGGPDPADVEDWIRGRTVTWEEYPSWLHGNENFGFYSNARVDELLDEGKHLMSYAERKPIYDEMQFEIHEDVGYIMLWNKWKIEAWSNDFAGFDTQRPVAWYGMYFRGNDGSSNTERGVYWRGGTVNPGGDTTTVVTTATATVSEFMSLQVLAVLGIFLTGIFFMYRRRRIRNT
jgi:peptide/nickel transport system substrate-binding protein